MESRLKIVYRASIVGIIINVLLATFKIIIGTIANAISVKLDGINNLSDAGSSFITLVGAAFAGRPADKKHPFGFGRIEYLSSLLISGLVLYAGITAFISAIQSILNKDIPEYSAISLTVMGIAVVIKFFLSIYTQVQGKKANSDSLIASGKEAILDVLISVATIVAAIIYIFTKVSLEAYLAAVISLFIAKTGFDLLKEIVSKIIGESGEPELIVNIKKSIREVEHVNGAYDLILNNYGPDTHFASVHIEVDDTYTAGEIDSIIRTVTEKVLKENGVILTAVGIYSHNTTNADMIAFENDVKSIVCSVDGVLSAHGFHADTVNKKMYFDIVVTLNVKDRLSIYKSALAKVNEKYPEYTITSAMDADFSEL